MSYLALVVKSVVYPTLLAFVLVAGLATYVQLVVGTEPATIADWNATKHIRLDGLTFTAVETSKGVRLNVIEAGDRNAAKLAVLLHGFPETALLSWHTLIPELVADGYFVVAPDQRGYNQSSKPEAVVDYTLDALAGDVRGLIQHYNRTRAVIIGHDWGAAVTWWMGQRHPDLVEKLVVMNVPHNHAFREHLRSSWSQLAKSWYIFYFQLPFVPELKLASNNHSFLQGIPARSGVPGKTFPLDSAPRYLQAWSEPGALSGMLNWYRAAIRHGGRVSQGVDPTIRVPTHIIWGKQDIALDAALVEKSLAFCAPGMCQATYLDQATHWVQHDEPEAVAHTVTAFLKQ